jgi:hypothetical protein
MRSKCPELSSRAARGGLDDAAVECGSRGAVGAATRVGVSVAVSILRAIPQCG